MAQEAVFTALQRGASIAVDEAIYLCGVSDKLESAKMKLMSMQAFLTDLENKRLTGGAMARNLVSEIRGVAQEVEDIIDTANILRRQSDPKTSIRGAVSKYICFPVYLAHLHKIGARIDSATARMKTIFELFERHNIIATDIAGDERGWGFITEDDAIQHWRSVHPDLGKEVDVIGFDEKIDEIKGDLLDRWNKDLSVFSIVGPGGAGKSTMANKVYGLSAVKTHFQFHAWMIVSQSFVAHDLLKELIKPAMSVRQDELDKMKVKMNEMDKIKNEMEKKKKKMEEEMDKMKKGLVEDELDKVEKTVKQNEDELGKMEETVRQIVDELDKMKETVRPVEDELDKMKEMFKRIMGLRQVEDELDKKTKSEAKKMLHDLLRSKTYLIVLDDIWRTDAWDMISDVFPDNKNGSRVILTTRNEAVANHPYARKRIYRPKLLNEEESTQLLLRVALPEYILIDPIVVGRNLDDFKKVGKDLAKKCCGLPLALMVLGGHLSRNLDIAEWRRLTSSVDWHGLMITDRIIGGIMDLSYYDMPSHLRSCFMYTTAFPEDSSIDVRLLSNLWVAEGFIPLVRGHTAEEVAFRYVTELVQRCMIQVYKRTHSGRIWQIKVHDVLRDWGIGLARREGLIKDCYGTDDIKADYSEERMKAYRVVLHGFLESKVGTAMEKLRTLLDFKLSSVNNRVQVSKTFDFLHHLRVLYLRGSGEDAVHLPKEIGRMRYLRYIGLGGGCWYHVPSSIGDLLSLEKVDASGGKIYDIPGSLWKIPTLRHVHVSGLRRGLVLPTSSLPKVHVTVCYSADNQGHKFYYMRVMDATKRQLSGKKEPSLSCCFVTKYVRAFSSGNEMEIIGRWKGENQFRNDLANLVDMVSETLVLKICCTNLLSNEQRLLELVSTEHIKVLEIGEQSYTGSVITFPCGSFPRLEILLLHDLAVEKWKVKKEAMIKLEKLTLCRCPNLRRLPTRLSLLPKLSKVNLIAMPTGFYQDTSSVVRRLENMRCEFFVSSDEKYFRPLHMPYSPY